MNRIQNSPASARLFMAVRPTVARPNRRVVLGVQREAPAHPFLQPSQEALRRVTIEPPRAANLSPHASTQTQLPPPLVPGALSAEAISNEAIRAFDGENVQCVSMEPGPRVGHLLTFHKKPEADGWKSTVNYPAVEHDLRIIIGNLQGLIPELSAWLGFAADDNSATIPSAVSLQHDFALLRAAGFDVPEVVLCADNQANDRAFIDGYLETGERRLLLAQAGGEYIHDVTTHLLPMLLTPLDCLRPALARLRLVCEFAKWAEREQIEGHACLMRAAAFQLDAWAAQLRDDYGDFLQPWDNDLSIGSRGIPRWLYSLEDGLTEDYAIGLLRELDLTEALFRQRLKIWDEALSRWKDTDGYRNSASRASQARETTIKRAAMEFISPHDLFRRRLLCHLESLEDATLAV